jgi:hypothetical protein
MPKFKLFAVVFLLLCAITDFACAEVLIVADEFPAMETLAAKLKIEEQIDSTLVAQTNLPASLSSFEAVIIYIHKDLSPRAEDAFIAFAKSGGKLVLLHHTISSGKRKNQHWFPFLGVSLPEGDVTKGGYKWIEGVTWQLVNLNPNHFIMTNKVTYPERIAFSTTNAHTVNGALPGFTLEDSEVYLNHIHTEPHALLMGLKFTDPKSGTTYMQDRSGWVKPAGKGWIIYLMPGHTARDFENPAYGRIVLNAIVWKP